MTVLTPDLLGAQGRAQASIRLESADHDHQRTGHRRRSVWPARTSVGDLINEINNSAERTSEAQINASSGTGIDILESDPGDADDDRRERRHHRRRPGRAQLQPLDAAFSELNDGNGVGAQAPGGPDMQITRSNGTTFGVSLASAKTIQDVINAINTADAACGGCDCEVSPPPATESC